MNNRSVFFYKKISVLPLSKNKERFSAKTKNPHKISIFLTFFLPKKKRRRYIFLIFQKNRAAIMKKSINLILYFVLIKVVLYCKKYF